MTMRPAGSRRVAGYLESGAHLLGTTYLDAGQLLLPDGSVGAPPIAFTAATGTGAYRTSTVVAMTRAGVETCQLGPVVGVADLTISNSLDVDGPVDMGGSIKRSEERRVGEGGRLRWAG